MEDLRYYNDLVFKYLVDMFHRGMKYHQFTPTDVREALLQASVRLEMDRPGGMFVRDGEFYRIRPDAEKPEKEGE